MEGALRELADWAPDLTFSSKILDGHLEQKILKVAPAVLFAHDYIGCVSGEKAFKLPVASPCDRRFGWQCLVHYYPRRCGGLNPVTMFTLYSRQSQRLATLHTYSAIVTASEHMRREYVKHGIPSHRVHCLPPPVPDQPDDSRAEHARFSAAMPDASDGWRLLYAGRMETIKGGGVLLDALAGVRRELNRPLRVVFAGDGSARGNWEARAKALTPIDSGIRTEFPGWVGQMDMLRLMDSSHLLVVPSVWPEPFGLIGPEAGARGLPAAAFAVGGIPEWLSDGVNGHLAPGDPPTAAGLAASIVKCLEDPSKYVSLRHGAIASSQRFNLQSHIRDLGGLFRKIVASEHSTGLDGIVSKAV